MIMQVFGLLHLADDQKSAMNVSVIDFREQILIYANNAKNMSKSLALNGIPYTVLTNDRSIIQDIASIDSNSSLELIEIPFSTKVPSGTFFYSAHYKLDAFKYIASLASGYYALCDLDMICINKPLSCLQNLIKAGIPMFYDISDQVIPAYGHEIIIRDLSKIGKIDSEGRWSGGEFIAGPPEFFASLVKEIEDIYNNYIFSISSLHHVGDEAYTSAALEKLRRKGMYIADAGTIGIVGRYWSTKVLHPQKPFDYFKNLFLLHLPADKKFLSELAEREIGSLSEFRAHYQKHQQRKRSRIVTKVKRAALFLRDYLRALLNKALNRTG